MTQRILVSGAGGFVCSNIVTVLLKAGWHVLALDRQFSEELRKTWAMWAGQIDLYETSTLTLPAEDVDALIHGAAITARPEDRNETPEDNFLANIDPLIDVLRWAHDHVSRLAIFISSDAVFRSTPTGAFDERNIPDPHGLYAVAKHTTEKLVETLRDEYGRDVVAVRLGNIYGPNESSRESRPRISLVGNLIDQALETNHLLIREHSPAYDWTFAPDVGHAMLSLVEASALQESLYHVASGHTHTELEIAQAIRDHLPKVDIDVSQAKEEHLQPGFMNSERLRQETGFDDWTSLSDGIRQTIAWKRQYVLGGAP